MAEPHPPGDFKELLSTHGYERHTLALVAVTPVVTEGATRDVAESLFSRLTHNYYMQFLALQLERYRFNLNRPMILASELAQADSIILGKLGNPPLDTWHLATLLAQTVLALMERRQSATLTWEDLFHFTYFASDGSKIRGQDLLRALIKSDQMHRGAHIETYMHYFRGVRFATCSMMQVMAEVLASISPRGLHNVNRFGQEVRESDREKTLECLARGLRLTEPRFSDFYHRNAHTRILATLHALRTTLEQGESSTKIHTLRLELERDNFNPGMYPRPWQRFLYDLDGGLQMIATPYA